MKKITVALIISIFMFGSGCSFVTREVGNYYLNAQKYQNGVSFFEKKVLENPNDSDAFFYLGRLYLSSDRPKKALFCFTKASGISPVNPDYYFWQGVSYSALKNWKQERQSYLKALNLDKKHVGSLTYLGHNFYERGEFDNALSYYNKAIEIDGDNLQALFNSAEIYRLKKEKNLAAGRYRDYLKINKEGSFPVMAVEKLNLMGFYDYRVFIIGKRRIPMESITFDPVTGALAKNSKTGLNIVKNYLLKNPKSKINVIVYCDDDKALAEKRAKSIKRYLIKGLPKVPFSQVKLGWFGFSEKKVTGSKSLRLRESVNLFTTN